MPINQISILKYAFAERGDKTEIALDTSPEGLVSWEQGYGLKYALNPELDGEYIQRDNFNYIMHIQSKGLKDLQTNGGRLWDSQSANLIGGFPAGARVMAYYDLTTGQITQEPIKDNEGNYLSSTIQLVSMRDQNITSPFEPANLFKSWWVDDGVGLFGLKFSTQNISANYHKIPSGYIDLGDSQVATKKYNYADYPRVKHFKDAQALPSYFTDNGDNTFSLVDLRGRFPRLFSNGGSIDSGRDFATLQGDAIRNIVGQFNYGINWYNPYASGALITENSGNTGIGSGRNYSFPYIKLSADRVVSTADEVRPNNFNIKLYIKL